MISIFKSMVVSLKKIFNIYKVINIYKIMNLIQKKKILEKNYLNKNSEKTLHFITYKWI